jgi:hypothetical protein
MKENVIKIYPPDSAIFLILHIFTFVYASHDYEGVTQNSPELYNA